MKRIIPYIFAISAVLSCSMTEQADFPERLLFTAECTSEKVVRSSDDTLWAADAGMPAIILHEQEMSMPCTKASPVNVVYDSLGLFGYRYLAWDESCRPTLVEDGLLLKRSSRWQSVDDIVTGPDGTDLSMRFYAYGPYRAEGLSFSCDGGAPLIHYEVPASVGDQVDLIAGFSGETGAGESSVGLVFRHVLSAVTFAVDASCTAATIKEIRLINIYGSADYYWSSGWCDHAGKTDFTVSVSESVQTGTASDITAGDLTMMLLPQTFAEDASIVLEMEVDGETVEVETSLAGVSISPGKSYIFRMNFDVSTYDSIFTYHILMSHQVNTYVSSGENLWLPEMKFESGTEKITVDWGDGTKQVWTSGTAVPSHSFLESYEGDVVIKIKGTSPKLVISGTHIQRIQKINIEGNERYDSADGSNCIIETATNTLVYAGIDYSIPSRVTILGPYSMVTVEDATLKVPEGITTIRRNAISGPNPYMKNVELPASLTLLEDGAFIGNGLYGAKVAPGNPVYDSRSNDTCIMVTETDYMKFGTLRMTFPEETKGVRPYACTHTPSVISLPESCLDLMSYSFHNNYVLKKMVLPAGCHVSYYAFSGCMYADFDFSAGDIHAGQYSFEGCRNIITLDLSYFSELAPYCFHNCYELLSVAIPEGTDIPEYAFSSCYGLLSVTVPSGCTVGKGAFSSCKAMTSADLHCSLGKSKTFQGCTSLATINLYDGFSSFAADDLFASGVTCINNYCHEVPTPVKCSIYKQGGVVHVLGGQDYTAWMATCGLTAKNWTWTDDLEEP